MIRRYAVLFFAASWLCASAQVASYYVDCRAASEPYQKAGNDDDWFIQIHCTANLDELVEVKLEDFVQGGGCTNCTAMSPADCHAYKADILNSVDGFLGTSDSILSENQTIMFHCANIRWTLNELRDQGEQFRFYQSWADVPGGTADEKGDYLWYGPTGDYLDPSIHSASLGPGNQARLFGSNNGIYNYYNDAVAPRLDDVERYAMSIEMAALNQDEELHAMQTSLYHVKDYVSAIPCTACQSGGGGSSTNVPSGGSVLCPCSEVLQNIKNLLEEMRDDLRTIREKVVKWDERLDQLKGWADRVEAMLKVCQDALAPIGTNFVYATQYRDIDGYEFETLHNLHEGLYDEHGDFDFSTFGKYTWFTRVEYLLADIAGLFVKTNSDPSVDEAIRRSDQVVDALESYTSDSTNTFKIVSSKGFDDLVKSLEKLFSEFSFLGGVSASVHGVKVISGSLSGFGIEYSQGVGIFEGSDESQVIMDRVISVVRTGCQLLYLLMFTALFYVCFIFIVKRSVLLVGWLCQFYSSVFGS